MISTNFSGSCYEASRGYTNKNVNKALQYTNKYSCNNDSVLLEKKSTHKRKCLVQQVQ